MNFDNTTETNVNQEKMTGENVGSLPDKPDASLQEGELYVFRKGSLEHILRNDDEGMRRIRILKKPIKH